MRIQSVHTIPANRQRAFDTLLSASALRGCIPGCESFDDTGEGSYSVTMNVGVGAVRGRYTATVGLSEVDSPESFRMTVEGKGSAGTIRGDGVVRLIEKGGVTEVHVDGQVQVSGVIARVGQRLLSGVSRSLLTRFFDCMAGKAAAP